MEGEEKGLDNLYYMPYNMVEMTGCFKGWMPGNAASSREVSKIESGDTMALQLSAPLLDGCVLSVLARGDTYGYALTQKLRQEVGLSESTLYPVLRRLQKGGCLTVYDRQFQGRNRRYYAVTEGGLEKLSQCRQEWVEFRGRIDEIMEGGEERG